MSGVDAHALQAGVLADHAPEVVEPGRGEVLGKHPLVATAAVGAHARRPRGVAGQQVLCGTTGSLCGLQSSYRTPAAQNQDNEYGDG